jgi:uncharacterized LabA/DUF88 family protein
VYNGFMSSEERLMNIAYIDAANLDKALRLTLFWELDYGRFRKWLSDKYKVKRAYIFIGLIPRYKSLYNHLQGCGFELVFKEVLYDMGRAKGNCDTDLVAQAMTDLYEGDLNRAVIVASDGDYAPLVKILSDKGKLETILSPAPSNKCSVLLKRTQAPIAYIDDQRHLLESKTKRRI